MIKSMTAFARESRNGDIGELAWELRSVNHRYLEPHIRLPEELRALEPAVRERLAARLQRGKVDCALRYV
ncbi:MAG: YicC/YloC family endoribonuclease, partial [Chromatiaceae bacterium]